MGTQTQENTEGAHREKAQQYLEAAGKYLKPDGNVKDGTEKTRAAVKAWCFGAISELTQIPQASFSKTDRALLDEAAAVLLAAAKAYYIGDGTADRPDVEFVADYAGAKDCFACYKLAAQLGQQEAYSYLGKLYYTGCGTQKDDREAVRWFEKSMAAGKMDCAIMLGYCYYNGNGTDKDLKKAFDLAADLAASGDPLAGHLVDLILQEEPGLIEQPAQVADDVQQEEKHPAAEKQEAEQPAAEAQNAFPNRAYQNMVYQNQLAREQAQDDWDDETLPEEDAYGYQGPQAAGYAPQMQGFAPQPQGYAPQGYGPQQDYAPQPQGYAPQQGYAPPPQGYGPQGYAPQPQGYGPQGPGYMPQDPYRRGPDYDMSSGEGRKKGGIVKILLLVLLLAAVLGAIGFGAWKILSKRGSQSESQQAEGTNQAGQEENAQQLQEADAPQDAVQMTPVTEKTPETQPSQAETKAPETAAPQPETTPQTQAPAVRHIYELIQTDMTWEQAAADARALGGYLACISDSAEQKEIENLMSSYGSVHTVWLGARRLSAGAAFTWGNGQPLGYTQWGAGEPNNETGDELYLDMYQLDGSWYWNDVPNDISQYYAGKMGYILEREISG